MVQRGIFLNSLDVSYVTSASIFFLFLFGSQGLFSLIFGDEGSMMEDPTRMMTQQMTGGLMGGGQQQQQQQLDYGALFKTEKENLAVFEHHFYLDQYN